MRRRAHDLVSKDLFNTMVVNKSQVSIRPPPRKVNNFSGFKGKKCILKAVNGFDFLKDNKFIKFSKIFVDDGSKAKISVEVNETNIVLNKVLPEEPFMNITQHDLWARGELFGDSRTKLVKNTFLIVFKFITKLKRAIQLSKRNLEINEFANHLGRVKKDENFKVTHKVSSLTEMKTNFKEDYESRIEKLKERTEKFTKKDKSVNKSSGEEELKKKLRTICEETLQSTKRTPFSKFSKIIK